MNALIIPSNTATNELEQLTEVINQAGYSLDNEQPHISGERFLMQAVTTTSGQKYILLGRRDSDNLRVVIKGTRDRDGQAEISRELRCRALVHRMPFAYAAFHSPEEIATFEKKDFLVSIQTFIEQPCAFIDRPLAEQFDFALVALKTQESAHATTHRHYTKVADAFGAKDATAYLEAFAQFTRHLNNSEFFKSQDGLLTAQKKLNGAQDRIEQYTGFLTHTDFVPHNFRIKDSTLYLLDFSALCFGNKHESWARFLNFMTLYNPELEAALLKYFKDNRSSEENESLHLMRLYRLGEIIYYYYSTLSKCQDNLCALNTARVHFWTTVLQAELNHQTVGEGVRQQYKKTRDTLRSDEEKKRQIGLH